MESYDVAGNICEAHCPPRYRNSFWTLVSSFAWQPMTWRATSARPYVENAYTSPLLDAPYDRKVGRGVTCGA